MEEFIIKGQKINSIKHYRNNSELIFRKQYSLKESKDACDKIQEDFSRELDRLREHLYQGTPVIESTTIKELTPREQYVFDIHKNIDEILSKKEK